MERVTEAGVEYGKAFSDAFVASEIANLFTKFPDIMEVEATLEVDEEWDSFVELRVILDDEDCLFADGYMATYMNVTSAFPQELFDAEVSDFLRWDRGAATQWALQALAVEAEAWEALVAEYGTGSEIVQRAAAERECLVHPEPIAA